jgi:anti-anti-sigma factor
MRSGVFQIEQQGDILVVVPTANLRELDFDDLEEGAEPILASIEAGKAKHVVVDFSLTDYYGSTALSFFVKLWKRIKCGGGRMVLCGVSRHEREILEITHLDGLWPTRTTRDEALAEVKRQVTAS